MVKGQRSLFFGPQSISFSPTQTRANRQRKNNDSSKGVVALTKAPRRKAFTTNGAFEMIRNQAN